MKARDVREGDIVDLKGDTYAGNGPHAVCCVPYEYAEVVEPVEWEAPNRVVVHTTQGSFAMPPDHELAVPR